MKRRHAPLLLLVIGAILAAPAAGQLPLLTVTVNASPGTVQTGDPVTLSATAADGTPPYTVTYFRGSPSSNCSAGDWIQIGSVTDPPGPPYSLQWTPGTAGTFAIKAEATDSGTPALTGCGDGQTVTVNDPPPADTDPPTAPVLTFETGPSAHPVDLTLYVNTGGPAGETYALSATTTDTMSGVREVRFPGGSSDTTGPPYRSSPYGLTELSGANVVTAWDNANNSSPTQFDVVADTAGPTGGFVDYVEGNDTDGQIPISVNPGADTAGGAGMPSSATGVLERQTVQLDASGTCAAWPTTWQQVATMGAGPTTDTIAAMTCARYQYRVSDNVGNETPYQRAAALQTVKFDTRDLVAPPRVSNARVRTGDHVVRLTYSLPSDPDLARVRIVRAIAGLPGTERLAFSGLARRFVDRSVLNGTRYVYEIQTWDSTGNHLTPGVVRTGRPKSRFLLSPRDGATLRRPPLLDWRARKRARFYNVKLLRDVGPGPAREVLSKFPRRSKLQLHRTWRHKGRVQRFRAGTYYWYVWPRIGGHYGALMGWQRFVVPRG